jgi:molybdenum cofactor biosynthesis protein B
LNIEQSVINGSCCVDPAYPGTPPSEFGSPTAAEHRKEAPRSVNVAVLTISDTRTKDSDRSGELIRQNLLWRGHVVHAYKIVPDDPSRIRDVLQDWIDDGAIEAIITNGGTGIAGRDNTFDTISALLEKRLDGFGEIFRMLSFQEIGAAAMLSRAIAGVTSGTAIFSTPGSSNAVKLAMEKLIGPELGHVVHEITK